MNTNQKESQSEWKTTEVNPIHANTNSSTTMNTNQEKGECEDCKHLPEGIVVAGHDHRVTPITNQESWKVKLMKRGWAEQSADEIEQLIEKEILPQARKETLEEVLKAIDNMPSSYICEYNDAKDELREEVEKLSTSSTIL